MPSSLIQSLPKRIARLEAKHGSDDPYVKDLKEQLRAMQENDGKTTQDVYRMQAVNFSKKTTPTSSSREPEETEEDGIKAEALRRSQVRRLFKGRQARTPHSSK